MQLLEDKRFLILYTCKTIHEMINCHGSRSISEQENGTVMFWQMTEKRTATSFSLSNFWLETLEREYKSLDGDGE